MGSHFHNWTDYNGVTFLVELLEWGRIFTTGLTIMGLHFSRVTTMGSHFHNRIDYNGVTFLVELLEWGRIFTTGLTIMGLHF